MALITRLTKTEELSVHKVVTPAQVALPGGSAEHGNLQQCCKAM